MPDILIRNISAQTKERLRQRAKRHGRSLAAELREVLESIAREDSRPAGEGRLRHVALVDQPARRRSVQGADKIRTAPPRPIDFE